MIVKTVRQFIKTTIPVITLCTLLVPQIVSAATISYDFSNPSDYTFDSSKIEFSNGQANLKELLAPAWYNSTWKYRKKITIDHTKVSGDVTNFPLLVSTIDTDLRDITSGGFVAQNDGGDMVFTESDGITALNYELEKYVSSNGTVVAWVKIPALSSTVDTDMYLYYGNESVSDQQNSTGVWDDQYQSVLHFSEAPVNMIVGHQDSTANGNAGTPFNFNSTSTSTTSGVGKIEGADIFDGTNDYVATNTIPVSAVGSVQEGVTTDGTYLYVSSRTNIYKYAFDGTLLATSAPVSDHIGGIEYYNGTIYAVQSLCPSTGTTSNHHVYKYDTNLQKSTDEYDIGADFTICAGAIAHYNDHIYVAESYYDNTHNDRIVEYDNAFNLVSIHTLTYQCIGGIQGIKYISPIDKLRVLCHSTDYYDVDTSFTNGSVQTGTAPFQLQDLAYVSGSTILYNNRDAEVITVVTDPTFAVRNFTTSEYTAQAWFRIDGGTGTRRFIFEGSPNWAISAEITAANLLAYYVQTNGTTVQQTTNITPTTGVWHSLSTVYKAGSYSKVYYDGIELSSYRGAPTGSLLSMKSLVIGTYRIADSRYFNGGLDEIRVSSVERSATWLATEYANQNNPSAFYSIGVQEVAYSSDNPSITSGIPLRFVSLNGFTEYSTKNNGEITYQISNDNGSTWYWHTSAGWILTTAGFAESNTAIDINAAISSFPAADKQFLWRAYLHSDGTQLVRLDTLIVSYREKSSGGGGGGSNNSYIGTVPQNVPTLVPAYVFARNLSVGIKGMDVLELQKYLNAHGFIVALTGVGSPGYESTYFGMLTRNALIKFQNAYAGAILTPSGLVKGTGYFGPRTRAFVNK